MLLETYIEELFRHSLRTIFTEKDVIRRQQTIDNRIAEIDDLITLQLNAIIHHEEFQTLEAAWRGLSYLLTETKPSRSLKIKLFQASKKDLLKDFERAEDFDQSNIYKRIYADVYDSFGENPFGLLIGNYEFSIHPLDISLLGYLSQIALATHAPFIAAASSQIFGCNNFDEINQMRFIDTIFYRAEYARWRNLRDSEEFRYVGLCLPHILLREPYKSSSGSSFNFEETVEPENLLWGNAAYAFGICVAKAYDECGWLGMMTGLEGDGQIQGLPQIEINGFDQSVDVVFEEDREKDLSDLGFMPLSQSLSECPAFYNSQSCHKARKYQVEAGTIQSRLETNLSYIFAVSRLTHYLSVIVRDRAKPFANSQEIKEELKEWLTNYSGYRETYNSREICLLRECIIDVIELPDKSGEFRCIAYWQPVYRLDVLPYALRTVFDLPKNLGG